VVALLAVGSATGVTTVVVVARSGAVVVDAALVVVRFTEVGTEVVGIVADFDATGLAGSGSELESVLGSAAVSEPMIGSIVASPAVAATVTARRA
jgi:hypothetical protein